MARNQRTATSTRVPGQWRPTGRPVTRSRLKKQQNILSRQIVPSNGLCAESVLSDRAARKSLTRIYERLFKALGPQHWWPAQTPFEVIVGAILTQNTNWSNVVRAIANLKAADCLSAVALRDIPIRKLATLIKPSGYFNIKAKRLKNFIHFMFTAYGGRLERMASEDLSVLRDKILAVNGVGPETADSILLYALEKPVFVIDAYTKRILQRHNIIAEKTDYEQVQQLFTAHLPADVKLFNEFHALFVRLGAEICRPQPLCQQCPLRDFYPSGPTLSQKAKSG